MIDLQDVTVCYDKHRRNSLPSLDNISLHIDKGELVFLVGPSGAGKSSLLKLLYAGLRVDSGRVEVDGQDISHLGARDIPALRRKIGVVFQDFQLLNEKTAFENVAFALRVIGVPQQIILKEVPRALETVGIDHRSHAFPHELSGGEQQRVAIARAIVNDPRLLLADEPTGNLDPETASQIGDLLAKINQDRGTTVVLVTHDRELVDGMARRVVRLKEGRIVADDFPGRYHAEDEALARPVSAAPVEEAPPATRPRVMAPADVGPPTVLVPAADGGEAVAAIEAGETPFRRPDGAAPEWAVATEIGSLPTEGGAAATESSAPWGGVPESEAPHEAPAKLADSPVPQALDNVAPLGSPENPIVLFDR